MRRMFGFDGCCARGGASAEMHASTIRHAKATYFRLKAEATESGLMSTALRPRVPAAPPQTLVSPAQAKGSLRQGIRPHLEMQHLARSALACFHVEWRAG